MKLYSIRTEEDKFSDFISIDEIIKETEEIKTKSSYVVMFDPYFTQEIYINEDQVIEIWSQNISTQTRRLYHKLFGRYPDGTPFSRESTPVEVDPGWWLCHKWTVNNIGKGIGFFTFSCEVWEEVDSYTNVKHDKKNDRYWAIFYRPSGVSTNYYCDDMWHHPSDFYILENALYEAGGTTSSRGAATALMNFVHCYIIADPDFGDKDICIVYLGRHNNRNILFIWGYGWQGTYAGSLFMSNPNNWSYYGNNHLLLLRWHDFNNDGYIQMDEISVETHV